MEQTAALELIKKEITEIKEKMITKEDLKILLKLERFYTAKKL